MVVNAPVFELLASSQADVVPPDKTTFLDLKILKDLSISIPAAARLNSTSSSSM